MTYLRVFVAAMHTAVTFLLSDDLAGILDNNLVGLESTVRADAVAPVARFAHFDADVVLSADFCPLA